MSHLALALIAVTLNASAQLLLRSGLQSIEGGIVSLQQFLALLPRILTSPWVIGGFAGYGLSVALWLVVLSKVPVSVAYPLQSMGFILVALFAHLLLKESLTPTKLLAILTIVAGVFLLARAEP
jgi:multidrug transporter EmrE-like cation transporter